MSRWLVFLLAWLPLLATAAPRAWLDRTSVNLGDTVTLNVESDINASAPDFSILEDKFRLLGTSSNSKVNIASGVTSASMLWAVALEPREAGIITIPAFTVAGQQTQALTLTVLPAPAAASAAAGGDVYVEVEALPTDPYVQQEVRYTLRLFYAVRLMEARLDEPRGDGVELRQLGQDSNFQRTVGNRVYSVVERHYALIPERSGAVTISAPRFEGRALSAGGPAFGFNSGVAVSARGDSIQLNVRPRPAQSHEPWLPADSLTLETVDASLPASLKVGEPLTLTYRLSARGLGSAQLPELTLPNIPGAQVYPDQSSARDSQDSSWLVGERERKFAIVPTQPGELVVPAMEIDWWNTAIDHAEIARVPERSFQVAGSATTQTGTVPAAPAAGDRPDTPAFAVTPSGGTGFWRGMALALALIWVLTLIGAWHWRARLFAKTAVPAAVVPSAPVPVIPKLKAALASGNLDSIARALLAQAAALNILTRNLGELARQLQADDQRDAAQAIERARFGMGDCAVALQAARAAFGRPIMLSDSRSSGVADNDPLPPLYSSMPELRS